MAVCARAIAQPDGTLLLALDPTVQDLSTCAYVVQDGATSAWQELGNLSIGNAHVIGLSVGLLWAGAYTIRLLARAIDPFHNESES